MGWDDSATTRTYLASPAILNARLVTRDPVQPTPVHVQGEGALDPQLIQLVEGEDKLTRTGLLVIRSQSTTQKIIEEKVIE